MYRGPAWTRADYYIVVIMAIAAFGFAKGYLPIFRAGGGVPQFYQDQFAPAVMLTCGRGFVNVDSRSVRALDDFLQQRRAQLRCEEIPPAIRIVDLSGFQGSSRYLMGLAALNWRFSGISFAALDTAIAALFSVSVAAAYTAVRLGVGRALAMAVIAVWAFSYRHLENVPHLRDYSKAPFFMLMLVAMALVAIERRPRWLVATGAAFGLVQGAGFGMRTDVALNFVPFFLILFAVSVADSLKDLRVRIACAAASLIVFVLVALPILQTYARNSSLWHIVLLGFTSPYDENLNIGFPRTAYRFPYAHNDSYIETVVRAYWQREHPSDPLLTMLTRPYDRACQQYCLSLARQFPADMLTRGIASVIGIVNLPFWLPDGTVPVGMSNSTVVALWRARGAIANWFYGSGLFLVAAILAVAGTRSRLYAVVGFLLVAFWGAFPAIEFQGRHIFHFELIMLAAFAWAAAIAWRGITENYIAFGRLLARASTTVAMLAVMVVATVASARAYQVPNARRYVQRYDDAASTPLVAAARPLTADRVRLGVSLFRDSNARAHVDEVLLRADFDFAQCGHPPAVTPVFHYETTEPWFAAFSHEVPLEDLGQPPTRVFVPVYSLVRDWVVVARFTGVDVPASFARCVRLARVNDPRDLPLVLPVTIAPDWQRKLYQRFRVGSGLGY